MKQENERTVFLRAEGLLNELYGEITIDLSQTDSPDAAFFCSREHAASDRPSLLRIGVEITHADKLAEHHNRYLNDKKIVKAEIEDRLAEIHAGIPRIPEGPLRSASILTPFDFFYEGIKGKADKYPAYMKAGAFEEIILLFTSEFMRIDDPNFSYLKRWTDHLLGKHRFPFNKAIFVCARTDRAELIFEKAKRPTTPPARKLDREVGTTISQSLPMPFGEAQLGAFFTAVPIVAQGKRKGKAR